MYPPWRLKVGIALGGGAARGLAHIGVLRAFVREGIPMDVVVGTSMGAIIGGAYAATGDIAGVERRVRDLVQSELFARLRMSFLAETRKRRGGLFHSMTNLVRRGIVYGVSTLRPSFLSAEEFARNMAEILPDRSIQSLPVRFGAVALDLEAGEEVVLCHGRLREAASASSAIPGILPPVRLHGRLLIDGGWVDKIPVLPAYRLGADLVIAVDISPELEGSRRYTRGIDVILRAHAIKDSIMVGLSRRLADVVVEPEVRSVHWADFAAIESVIKAGDEGASRAVPRIRDLLRHERWRSMVRAPSGKRMADRYLASAELRFSVE